MKISDLSIRRPVLTSMLSAALVLFGAIGYSKLTVREFPDVDPPVISVSTFLRGANPRVMESAVTDILEEELSTVPGLKTLTSSSAEQFSNITLEFTLDRDIESAAQDVRDKVSRVRFRLPQEIEEPVVAKQDADANPFFYMALSGPNYNLLQLSDIADRIVKTRVQSIPGVGQAQILGERRFSMRVWLSASELSARGLTVADVENAIKSRNVEVPAGRIESSRREFTVRSMGELKNPEEFGSLVVSNQNGQLVKLRDIASVELGPEDDRTALRYKGTPAVAIGVVRQSKANLVDVAEAITKELPSIQGALPPGVQLNIGFNQAVFVQRSIKEAEETLLIAAALVVVIIFLFLRNFRATIIPGLAIPTSIIATFAIMYFLGFSINNFTLLALTLAIGIVVDDAIIVLENAYRHQEELHEDPETAATNGTREIGFAVIATTISLVAVFTPLAFLQGTTGRLFNEFGIAVAGAVVISGLIALTLTPMLSAKILRVPHGHGKAYQTLERGFDALASGYAKASRRAVAHRWLTVGGALATVLVAVVIFRSLKREFVPPDDRGYFPTIIVAPEGATLDYVDGYQRRVEAILAKTKDVEAYFSIVGIPRTNGGIVFTRLVDWSKRKRSVQDVLAEVQPQYFAIPGIFAFAANPPAFGGFGTPVQFVVRNSDFDSLVVAMDTLTKRATAIKGLLNVDTDLRVNKPELTVSFDRDRAEDLGVPVRDVATTLQTLLGGNRVSTFTRSDKLYDVIVQMKPEQRATPSDMSGLYVRGSNGQAVQLSAVAKVSEGVGPRQLNHFQRVRSFTLSASLAPGFALGEALDSLNAVAADVLPKGSTIAYSGESRELNDSGTALYFAFILALVVVFMVLASQFESLVHPFTVLLAVPLAVTGALVTLLIAGSTLNLYSQIGMILLIGLVTKNSILLVEYANQLKAKGMDSVEAILESGRIRLRPILMTSVATVMGAVPIAFGLGAGATSRRPLGYAIVGGVLFSTVLTLFLVPAVYVILDALSARARTRAGAPAGGGGLMTGLIAALAIVGTLHVVGISEAASVERPASSDHGTAGKSRLEVRPLDAGRSTLAADSTLPVVTLDDALRRAARLDPQYVQAQGNLDVAEWQRRAAYSALVLPSLNLSTDVTRYSTPNFNAGTFNQQLVAANAYATARYDVFTGGRKLAEASAARANVRRAEAGELEARYGSALRTETDYYQVLLDQELDRVARERVERAQEQLVVARARVTSGASVQTDSLQLRLEVNRARVELLRQDAAVRVSRLQLGRRVGFDGPVQAAPLDSAVPAELPVTLEQTITEARQRGPTYVAARESERAAEAGVRAQRGSYLPAVSVSATSAAFDDSFFPGQTTRTWGTLALNFPLWNGGQRELAVSQAAASRAVARATRLDAERAVERDVTERYERYGTARATVELSADAVVVARENYRVEQTRYKGGAGTILELLSAQDRLTQAEADLVRARYDARLALAGLESILGRRLFNDRNIP